MDAPKPSARPERTGDALTLTISGNWRLTEDLPAVPAVLEACKDCGQVRVVPGEGLAWDTSLPLFLLQLRSWCRVHHTRLVLDELPSRLRRLLRVLEESESKAPPAKESEREKHLWPKFVRRLVAQLKGSVEFIGECALGLAQAPVTPRQVYWKDLYVEMVQAGPKALPIIGLLSFLIGVVFAFETTTQLRRFGAEIYVINALGVAVVRQIGPILAAVLLAGRTGAAFAAHLGNMRLDGEIDALEVLGVSPVTFLVLPRLAALFWILPMLTLYSDLFGLLGGLFTTSLRVKLPAAEFWVKTQQAITFSDIGIGLIKAVVFGVLIGFAGTLRGLQCERSAAGVGRAATSAVVTGIAAIIAANTFLSPVIDKLGR